MGETTSEVQFALEAVACLVLCEFAPAPARNDLDPDFTITSFTLTAWRATVRKG
jgi:hypothetical protein